MIFLLNFPFTFRFSLSHSVHISTNWKFCDRISELLELIFLSEILAFICLLHSARFPVLCFTRKICFETL